MSSDASKFSFRMKNLCQNNFFPPLIWQDNFPFDPPFVRVVAPVLSGGWVCAVQSAFKLIFLKLFPELFCVIVMIPVMFWEAEPCVWSFSQSRCVNEFASWHDLWFPGDWQPCFLQGWSSAYSIESVIMQINATLVKGKARVQFGANKVTHTLAYSITAINV